MFCFSGYSLSRSDLPIYAGIHFAPVHQPHLLHVLARLTVEQVMDVKWLVQFYNDININI